MGSQAELWSATYWWREPVSTAERIIELLHPRLVLGISDELAEGCEEEGIERVRMISEWCRSYECRDVQCACSHP